MSKEESLFTKYFKAGLYQKGFDEIIPRLPEQLDRWSETHARWALAALQLGIVYQQNHVLEEYFQRFAPTIKRLAKDHYLRGEVDLMEARIAYTKGYYLRAYRILEHSESLQQPPAKEDWKFHFLLCRVNDLAGKALHRNSDHVLARAHTAFAFDRLQRAKDLRPDKKQFGEYMEGKIYTIFARSYFDFPRFAEDEVSNDKTSAVTAFLDKANLAYDNYYGTQERQRLFYAEILELRALYLILLRNQDGKLNSWFQDATNNLKAAVKIVDTVLGEGPKRRSAHLLRYTALAHLRRGQQLFRRNAWTEENEEKVRYFYTKADALYREEITLRRKIFHTAPHPTLARAYNYRARTNICLAEFIGEQLKRRPPRDYSPEAMTLRQQFEQHCKLAERMLDLAHRANLKPAHENQYDLDLARKYNLPTGNQTDCINDYQLMRTKGRLLQLLNVRYRYAEMSDRQQKNVYEKMWREYQACYRNREETMGWLCWEESRQTILDEFRPIQESVLEICHLRYLKHPRKDVRRRILHRMLIIHQQVSDLPNNQRRLTGQSPPPTVSTREADDDFREKMQSLQWAIFKRLEDKIDKSGEDQSIWDGYAELTSELIESNRQMINKQKKALQYFDFKKAGEDLSIPGIFRAMDGDTPGALVSLLGGNKYVFALCLFQRPRAKNKGEVRSLLLNPTAAYTGVKEIKDHTKALADIIGNIHQQVEQEVSNKGKKRGRNVRKDNLLFNRLLCHNGMRLCYDPLKANTADYLNTRLLTASYNLKELLVKPLDIPNHVDRIYFAFNQGHLQIVPFNLLCLEDPEDVFSQSEERPFSDMTYFGYKYQNAVVPSLDGLWELRRERTEKDTTTNVHRPSLNGKKMQAFFGVYGGRNREDHHAPLTIEDLFDGHIDSIGKQFAQTMRHSILPERFGPNDFLFKTLRVPEQPDAKTSLNKKDLFDQTTRSLIVHFYCHVHYSRPGRRFGLKKIVLYEYPGWRKEHSPTNLKEDPMRKNYEIHPEGVIRRYYNNCFLVFINGCGSAEGKPRPGDIPESIVSAFLRAGARGCIGTHYRTYTVQSSQFSENFYNHWLDKGNNLTVSEALRATIRVHLNSPSFTKATHPLHWGGYLYMGDMTLKVQHLIDFANEFNDAL